MFVLFCSLIRLFILPGNRGEIALENLASANSSQCSWYFRAAPQYEYRPNTINSLWRAAKRGFWARQESTTRPILAGQFKWHGIYRSDSADYWSRCRCLRSGNNGRQRLRVHCRRISTSADRQYGRILGQDSAGQKVWTFEQRFTHRWRFPANHGGCNCSGQNWRSLARRLDDIRRFSGYPERADWLTSPHGRRIPASIRDRRATHRIRQFHRRGHRRHGVEHGSQRARDGRARQPLCRSDGK